MTKISISLIIAITMLSSCKSTIPNSTNDILNVSRLNEDFELLKKLTFKEAVHQFGKPMESEKIKIEEGKIPNHIPFLIDEYFPNKIYQTKTVYLLEASWKRQKHSWITVWYKLEDNSWKLIGFLLTV